MVALKHTQNLHSLHNYKYDKIGNLVADKSEEIEEISWTMQGKVKRITRLPNSQKPDLVFNYDGLGNRVSKTVIPKNSVNNEDSITTYYVRDAQGNILATYEKTKYKNGDEKFYLKEQYLYGSTRIGMNVSNQLLASNINGSVEIKEYDGYFTKTVGNKRFELTNHLGNVLAVVSDKKGADNEPDVVSVSDYYPFGMTMPGRSFNANSFRFGFNQAEKIDEISSIGNTYDLGARFYSSLLGKLFTPDPREREYPWQSTYAYYSNSPIWKLDYKGMGGSSNTSGVPAKRQADGSWSTAQSSTYVPVKEEAKPIKMTEREELERASRGSNNQGTLKQTPTYTEKTYAASSDFDKGVSGNPIVQATVVGVTAYVAAPMIISTVTDASIFTYVKGMSLLESSKGASVGIGIGIGILENYLSPLNPDASQILPLNPYSEMGRQASYIWFYSSELKNEKEQEK